MDRPQPVTAELKRDLANLRSLNRWFGSHRLVRKFLQRWLRDGDEIIDLATASGDIPRLIVDFAKQKKALVRVTAVDQLPATITIAKQLSGDYPEITYRASDLFQCEGKFDVVLCSLALHHFSEGEAIRVLRKCAELSRGAVLVADLRRARWLSAAVWLVTELIYREPMSKTDARLSAARAFSFRELRGLAEQAGWTNFGHARFFTGRQAIWLDRREISSQGNLS